jgi:flagellar hook assembly protein FlgD
MLAIYDVAGRLVSTLVDGETGAGEHVVMWDGTDRRKAAVSSGIYFYRLTSGEESSIRRMQLVR